MALSRHQSPTLSVSALRGEADMPNHARTSANDPKRTLRRWLWCDPAHINSVAAENEFVLEQSQESSNQSDTREQQKGFQDPYTPRVIVHPTFQQSPHRRTRQSKDSASESLGRRATGVPHATYSPRCDAGAGFVGLGAQAAAPQYL
jgi:hypothetical protein